MKKIFIELTDDDAEECVYLFRRVTKVLARLDSMAEDLEELKEVVENLLDDEDAQGTGEKM